MNFIPPFSYDLPEDRIAQRPVHPPEAAKMLVVYRDSGRIEHSTFAEIGELLKTSDRLVFNDTKVIPARLFGQLEEANGYDVEVVLVEEVAPNEWMALGFPMRKIRVAKRIFFNQQLSAIVVPSIVEDRLRLKFISDTSSNISELIDSHGTMPIPPYIRDGRGDELDRIDYQSIFALHPGSVAAPTASLHFSESLISKLKTQVGCAIDRITLHVGTASFQPIVVNGLLRRPGAERFNVSRELIRDLFRFKRQKGRIVAVGTTVVRALESAARIDAEKEGDFESTELFIEPGFEFLLVDALVTNFHQPRTTHLLLVQALLGEELLGKVYQEALSCNYRFLSYGDGMLIL